jgi:hypothetical protein
MGKESHEAAITEVRISSPTHAVSLQIWTVGDQEKLRPLSGAAI